MTHAPRVSISYRDFKNNRIDIFARTSGPERIIDIKYALPLICPTSPILIVRDVKKSAAFRNHPIMEMMPNLTSLASYVVGEDDTGHTVFTVWNPAPKFFDNEYSTATMERLIEITKAVLQRPKTPNLPITATVIELANPVELTAQQKIIKDEPASEFLVDTLIAKQRLLARNGCSYLGLRTWRKPIKAYQISALTALKRSPSPAVVDTIAKEMYEAVHQTYGSAFQHVVPVPCGSSGVADCLSVQLAESLSKKLGIQFSNVLQSSALPGKSHPKNSSRLEPFVLNGAVSGNVLIVDDVVTSGKHVELATKALRTMSSFCTAITWIAD